MNVWLRALLSVALLVAGLSFTTAPADAAPGIGDFRLSYSTLGYDSRATKRVLVSSLVHIDEADVSLAHSSWALKSGSTVVASGPLTYAGATYGDQYWEADLSAVTTAGTYTLHVTLKQNASTTIGVKQTLPFKIQTDLLWNNVIIPLTLNNADSRMAPASLGGGYYDCSLSNMGESNSHGTFLNALVQLYDLRAGSMSAADVTRTKTHAARAFDYVNQLWTSTGQFKHQYTTRWNDPDGLWGGMYDIEPLWGMAAYLAVFKTIDPSRANSTTFNRLVTTYNFLKNHPEVTDATAVGRWAGADEYRDFLIPVAYHLYEYSGDVYWKNEAISQLNGLLGRFDLRTHYRSPFRGTPIFEGLRYLTAAFPADPNHSNWIAAATRIKNMYYRSDKVLTDNAFEIINTTSKADAAFDWDNGRLSSNDWGALVMNDAGPMYAADAAILARVTGDRTLERVATGELNWVLGLNPGAPQADIQNPTSTTGRESAAFIGNLNARHVRTAANHTIWTPANNTWMSIVNGFSDGWIYDHDIFNRENFIAHDGQFAYAALLYEDLLSGIGSVPTAPAPPSGYLDGAVGSTPGTVNLAGVGTLDWAHWGLTTANSFNHKSGVPQRISNVSLTAGGTLQRFANSFIGYSWTGGTPTAAATGSTTGVYVAGTGNGLEVTVPADATRRTVRFHVGAYNAKARVEARLSDGSADNHVAVFDSPAGTQNRTLELTYRAGSAGQTLTFTISVATDYGGGGNVTLQAATLAGSSGGALTGSQSATPSSVNLSATGSLDWAHWGLSSASSFDHKSGVPQQISNYTPIGSGTVLRCANCGVNYSWSGGTPTASGNTTTAIYVLTVGNGFQITVPAGTTPRTLKLYTGVYQAKARIEASLSDRSAQNYVTFVDNANGTLNRTVSLTFSAASAGQTLTIKILVAEDYGGGGNATLHAAALE